VKGRSIIHFRNKKVIFTGLLVAIILIVGAIFFSKPIAQKITSIIHPESNKHKAIVDKKCYNPQTCHIKYASNVAEAVSAIRSYTKNPKLDVAPVQNTITAKVTKYCTKDKQCWGVDNTTYKVVTQ
jgi:hypothetical protein